MIGFSDGLGLDTEFSHEIIGDLGKGSVYGRVSAEARIESAGV